MADVAVVDYGAGNVASVARALARVGARPELTADPDRVRHAERVVFPGQGSLPDVMAKLRAAGLDVALRERAEADRPFLGICVGLQALFAWGEEGGGCEGLGILPGRVVRFPDDARDDEGRRLKVPHMGWSALRRTDVGRAHPFFAVLPEEAWFYFVHSYYAVSDDPSVVAGEATYGVPFCAAVARGALVATQFHPEKSQALGEALLEAFVGPGAAL